MKIAFVYLPGRLQRLDASTDGILTSLGSRQYQPTEFFYGAFELRDRGHAVGLFEAVERPRRSTVKFLAEKFLKMKYMPVKTYTGIIDAVFFLLPELSRFDVVVATTPGIAFSLGIWEMLGMFKRPVVGIQCGILNYSLNRPRVFLTGRLMRNMWSQLYGIGELAEMQRVYGVAADRIEVNCFGVDTSFWIPGKNGGETEYVIAVGNDALRDFDCLVRASEKSDVRTVIVSKRKISGQKPESVKILAGTWHSGEIDDGALRDLYRRALVAVVPLKSSLQPSGQSVCLQAMACGRPVILTRTPGVWDREALIHKKNVYFVPPGDPVKLAQAIEEMRENNDLRERIARGGMQYVHDRCRIEQFAGRLEQLCERIYGRGKGSGSGREVRDEG